MIAFSIGSFNVYRYGLFYLASFLIGYVFLWYVGRLAKQNKIAFLQKYPKVIHLLSENLDDLMLGFVIGVLVGGRLGHVIIYNFSYYLANVGEIFALWHGGMSFVGGIIGVVIALLILKYKYTFSRRDLFVLFDIILLIVPLGIILGRFGNFLNQELYGIIVDPTIPGKTITLLQNLGLAHIYPKIDTILRRNTNLFSLLLEGVFMWLTLLYVGRKQYVKNIRKVGRITILFLFLYSIFRFALEYIRQDSQTEFIGWFSITQWCMIAIWIGIALCFFFKRKYKKTM